MSSSFLLCRKPLYRMGMSLQSKFNQIPSIFSAKRFLSNTPLLLHYRNWIEEKPSATMYNALLDFKANQHRIKAVKLHYCQTFLQKRCEAISQDEGKSDLIFDRLLHSKINSDGQHKIPKEFVMETLSSFSFAEVHHFTTLKEFIWRECGGAVNFALVFNQATKAVFREGAFYARIGALFPHEIEIVFYLPQKTAETQRSLPEIQKEFVAVLQTCPSLSSTPMMNVKVNSNVEFSLVTVLFSFAIGFLVYLLLSLLYWSLV
jgi:hypothetical protein